MELQPGWGEIGLRLALTMLAGAALGIDRSAKGHAAGLKTTMLVALAACLAMLQANLLLATAGKPQGSFVSLDMMRLPLGVLTGVGFIGGGAIVKHNGSVAGVTTAATLWTATVIGLCFGGGQIALGAAGTGISFLVLRGLRPIEKALSEKREVTLTAQWRRDAFDLPRLQEEFAAAKLDLCRLSLKQDAESAMTEARCVLAYMSPPGRHGPPAELVTWLASARTWEWSE